jgi:hypothetical protein
VVPTTVDIFKKPRSTGFTKWKKNKALGLSETRRKPVKFGAVDYLSSSSDSEDLESESDKPKLPWRSSSHPSSTHTLVEQEALTGSKTVDHDIDSEVKRLKIQKQHALQKNSDTLDYSDYEEDLSTVYHDSDRTPKTAAHTEGRPDFLKRHHATTAGEGLDRSQSMAKPVPATPSLIKALDRIAVAQRDAFGSPPPGIVVSGLPAQNLENVNTTGSPNRGHEIKSSSERAPRWEDFWREVRVKAQTRG